MSMLAYITSQFILTSTITLRRGMYKCLADKIITSHYLLCSN